MNLRYAISSSRFRDEGCIMQYEDLSGCLWTQHEDDDGFVYFFNESTQVIFVVAL